MYKCTVCAVHVHGLACVCLYSQSTICTHTCRVTLQLLYNLYKSFSIHVPVHVHCTGCMGQLIYG